MPASRSARRSAQGLVGVHLDLKGMRFRPVYDAQLLADLAAQGVNAVLIEYEDAFPFEQRDLALDPGTVWSRARVRRFREAAAAQGIEVIPLQQCLGHLEYVFRWDARVAGAEDRDYPGTLSLRSPSGKALVKDMLRQMLEAHPDSRYIHLGMDEAAGLVKAAARCKRPVLALFTEWLEELVALVEAYGKTPIIWSDMLEDHFDPGLLAAWRDRVILAPWDYCTGDAPYSARGRLVGWRASRAWLASPLDPAAPALADGSRFVEDLPAPIRRMLEPYRQGRLIRSFFQVDLWTKLGFRVIGACALRVSVDGASLPDYAAHATNIRGYAGAIRRNGQMGLIGTSWARGTTFCPPNFAPDLQWPLVGTLCEAMGVKGRPFFPGVPGKALWNVLDLLSRNRADWRMDTTALERLRALGGKATGHGFEWRALELMAEYQCLRRRVEYAILEVDFFVANAHPVPAEWRRRLRDEAAVLKDVATLRAATRRHFAQRYHGAFFAEWLDTLFLAWETALARCVTTSRAKLRAAARRYAAPRSAKFR